MFRDRAVSDETWSSSGRVSVRGTGSNAQDELQSDFDCESRLESECESDSMAGPGGYTQVRPENDHLLQRIAYHKAEGRARSRRKPWSQTLVQREVDFWQR